jgi:23S rRNA (adenine-N6)-dimethyltransferase
VSRSNHRREYSQNFISDPAVVARMIRIARPTGLVLEPGGGAGALTRALTAHATVWTWELDEHFADVLRRSTSARVIRGDFARARVPDRPFDVVGNIPFSATSRIVDWCLSAPHLRSATLMTQLQYALKRSGGYGRWSQLTALTWHTHEWSFHGRVAASAFRPVPSVDSGILRIVRRPTPLLTRAEGLLHARVVQCGFRGVGGSVGASLRREFGARATAATLRRAGVEGSVIVARVHPDAWLTIAKALNQEIR